MGKFIGEVMKTYFKDMSAIDRRSMLASMVRFSNADSTPAQMLGAMFKGAGPIMQKILQRLPPDALSEDLKIAFADMKCNLAPIPDRIIQAHLLELVNSSNGEISKISVVKSLGAASVGQAVLCKFFTKDHPEGIDKVVKFLRPDVQNRAEREKQIFIEAAKKVPGMDVTFAGDLKTILEELDLTVEANNVETGQIYSNNSTKVKSMTLSTLVRPSTDVMVLDLAPGVTLDKCIRDANETYKKHLMPFTHFFNGTGYQEIRKYKGEVHDKFEHQNYRISLDKYNKLSEQYQLLLKQQQNLMTFTKNWVSEGIFGNGFYHGDLHSGNIMTSPDQLTIIDFGNCTQLTPDQQLHITKMMAAAMYSDSSAFIDSLTALLSDTSKARLNEHVNKDDPNSPLVKDRMKTVLSAVLSKGKRKDSGSRILVALQEVLKLGVEMPAPIYNFSKCQIALNNAIEELNQVLKDTYNAMRIAAGNVQKRPDDPVSVFMYCVGCNDASEEKDRLKRVDRDCATAKKDINSPEYKQYILELFDQKHSGSAVDDVILCHLEGHDDLVGMYDQYRQCLKRRNELEEILKKIPEPGTENDPAQEEYNQTQRELISRELESVNVSARDIFEGFFEPFKAIVTQDIDDIAEKARSTARGAKGYDDFLDCMGEVLKAKRSQAVANLGTGKLIKYAIPMLLDNLV
jgi:predicted unusual protein kinase regulating ubiquinone biosynthesis (AarF/ABC1/UbiB family)